MAQLPEEPGWEHREDWDERTYRFIGVVVLMAILVACALLITAVVVFADEPVTKRAGGWHNIARYEMNEGPRQDRLHDSTNHHINGVIGRKIERNGRFFHFNKVRRDWRLDPARTARVNSPRLNPGSDPFSITWRSRTDKKLLAANIMQKGQGLPAGGMFKVRNGMEVSDTYGEWLRVFCLWRGSNGDSFTETPRGRDLRDGKWHTYKCSRTAAGVKMFMDGRLVDSDTNPGRIANDWPLSIGGNHAVCEDLPDERRHCNYWAGDLDWIHFERKRA